MLRYYITPIALNKAMYMKIKSSLMYGIIVESDYNEEKEKDTKKLRNLISMRLITGETLTGVEISDIKPTVRTITKKGVDHKRVQSFQLKLQNQEKTVEKCIKWKKV